VSREYDTFQGIVEIERLARLDATTGYGIRIIDEGSALKPKGGLVSVGESPSCRSEVEVYYNCQVGLSSSVAV
jgi:hypothetical protein